MTGDLQLITYKAAAACHLYGREFRYVVKASEQLGREKNIESLSILRMHDRNSVGFYSSIGKKSLWIKCNWLTQERSSYYSCPIWFIWRADSAFWRADFSPLKQIQDNWPIFSIVDRPSQMQSGVHYIKFFFFFKKKKQNNN